MKTKKILTLIFILSLLCLVSCKNADKKDQRLDGIWTCFDILLNSQDKHINPKDDIPDIIIKDGYCTLANVATAKYDYLETTKRIEFYSLSTSSDLLLAYDTKTNYLTLISQSEDIFFTYKKVRTN